MRLNLAKWLQYCKIIDENFVSLQQCILIISCEDAKLIKPELPPPHSGSMDKLWGFDTFYVEGLGKSMAIVMYNGTLLYHCLHTPEPFMEK